MDSHTAGDAWEEVEFGKGEKVGDEGEVDGCGIEEHGQASPRETPLMAVRLAGQMGARPFISMFQRTGMETMGVAAA